MNLERRGWFITIEGVDGAGKTTQVDLLCQRLKDKGIPFVRTREPGGTPVGDAIRALLLDPSSEMTPVTEAYLYASSRAEHVRRVVLPALLRGLLVVCDRFLDASVAYQGYGLADPELTEDAVLEINRRAVSGITPDKTIVIDIDVELAMVRLSARDGQAGQDRLEQRGPAFFARVREGLRSIRDREPERVAWVDGSAAPEDVSLAVWQAVEAVMQRG